MRVVLVTLLALAAAAPVAAQEPTPTPPPEERIAPGVSVSGVDLGGLLVEEAAAKLETALGSRLERPVVLKVARRTFPLTPGQARFRWDALATARDAYEAGQAAPPPPPEGGSAAPGIEVPLRTNVNSERVERFVTRVGKAVYVAPRNARLRFSIKRMRRTHSHKGKDLEDRKVARAVEAALRDPRADRSLRPGRREVKPQIDAFDLERVYPTVVTVDRSGFRLRLFKRLKLVKSYGIAVGAPGYSTPTGTFSITNKAVNPVWTAPNAPWAGEFAGRSVPGGSAYNPLKARWLGIVNGVGIHGTSAEYSIGTRASHGCIRMRVADVIDLYPRVPVGTRVFIR